MTMNIDITDFTLSLLLDLCFILEIACDLQILLANHLFGPTFDTYLSPFVVTQIVQQDILPVTTVTDEAQVRQRTLRGADFFFYLT